MNDVDKFGMFALGLMAGSVMSLVITVMVMKFLQLGL